LEKLYCKEKSRELEERLNGNFTYIQKNAGGVLLSSVSSLFFPGKKTENKVKSNGLMSTLPVLAAGGLGFSNYLSLGKGLLPHIWAIAKPILLTWGLGKTQSMLLGKLFGKKKKK